MTTHDPMSIHTLYPLKFDAFFVFDVESVGLHGEAFAVAGGLYDNLGKPLEEFAYHTSPDKAKGSDEDRAWVGKNVKLTYTNPVDDAKHMRELFWRKWMAYKAAGVPMFVECGWPVEANFLEACIKDDPESRNWDGPYPMHEIATLMAAAGMDPMKTYKREAGEFPAHDPLADARLSARLLAKAFAKLKSRSELASKYRVEHLGYLA